MIQTNPKPKHYKSKFKSKTKILQIQITKYKSKTKKLQIQNITNPKLRNYKSKTKTSQIERL
jgi:hypothetical protein